MIIKLLDEVKAPGSIPGVPVEATGGAVKPLQ